MKKISQKFSPSIIILVVVVIVAAIIFFYTSPEKKVSETMTLYLAVQDKEAAKISDCGITQKVAHQVPKTTAVVDASLKLLFKDELSAYGSYASVAVKDNVARVMLKNNTTPKGLPISALSSCESRHLLSVLNDTLTQYPAITSVKLFSPEGEIGF